MSDISMANPFEAIFSKLMAIENSLEQIRKSKQNEEPNAKEAIEENMSIAELAKYLKCSKVTIHKYKKRGLFPFYGTGKMTYFKRSDVDAALSSQPKRKGSKI